MSPRLSIITAVHNRRGMIEACLDSVAHEELGEEVEHIVVDGGSTDGTLDVLRSRSGIELHTGPDDGVYDAMNRGLELARGHQVGFLNSDDVYLPGALRAVLATASAPVVSGAAQIQEPDGTVRDLAHPAFLALDLEVITMGTPAINARFFERDVIQDVGGFDLRYPLAADRDLLLRLWATGVRSLALDVPVYRYRSHEGSLTFASDAARRYARDHVAIAERLLADPAIPVELKAACRRWRALEGAREARRHLRSGDVGAVFAALGRAVVQEPSPVLWWEAWKDRRSTIRAESQ